MLGGHVVIAVRVILDLLNGLAGVEGENSIEALLEIKHETNGAFDIRSGALGTTGYLMNHHMGVRQTETFAFGSSS